MSTTVHNLLFVVASALGVALAFHLNILVVFGVGAGIGFSLEVAIAALRKRRGGELSDSRREEREFRYAVVGGTLGVLLHLMVGPWA